MIINKKDKNQIVIAIKTFSNCFDDVIEIIQSEEKILSFSGEFKEKLNLPLPRINNCLKYDKQEIEEIKRKIRMTNDEKNDI